MKTTVLLCAAVFAAAAFSLCSPTNAAQPLMVAPFDIDVYDQPGGEGKPRHGYLPGCSKVELMEPVKDDWCHVKGDAVPGNEGWIWCGMGGDGKDYSLVEVMNASNCSQDGDTDATGEDEGPSGDMTTEPAPDDSNPPTDEQ
jgi:hypothetical protein